MEKFTKITRLFFDSCVHIPCFYTDHFSCFQNICRQFSSINASCIDSNSIESNMKSLLCPMSVYHLLRFTIETVPRWIIKIIKIYSEFIPCTNIHKNFLGSISRIIAWLKSSMDRDPLVGFDIDWSSYIPLMCFWCHRFLVGLVFEWTKIMSQMRMLEKLFVRLIMISTNTLKSIFIDILYRLSREWSFVDKIS